MNKLRLQRLKEIGLKITIFAAVSVVSANIAKSQTYYPNNVAGDVVAGFRKTGVFVENNEMVVRLGNITNFLSLSVGTTINITNYGITQITNLCPDNFENLQWSVFSTFPVMGADGPWATPMGSFPTRTCWISVPRVDANTPTTPPPRQSATSQSTLRGRILGVGVAANQIEQALGATNAFSNVLLSTQPGSFDNHFSSSIGNTSDSTIGDFGGQTEIYGLGTIENTTPSPFSSAQRCDFYQMCPKSFVDPISGTNNGPGYYIGYFTLNTDGTMTFTRATLASGGGGTPPRPVLTILSARTSDGLGGSQVTSTIAFNTTNGATYTLYFTNAAGLTTPITNWPSLTTTVTGDGSMHAFTNSTTNSSFFYSVGAH